MAIFTVVFGVLIKLKPDPGDPSGRTLYALYHNENYPETLPYDEASGTG